MIRCKLHIVFMGNKKIILKVFLTAFQLVILSKDVDCASAMRGHKARLIHDLLDGYDPDARPEKDDSYRSEPTVVRFSITYNQLQHLDEPTQVARSLVWINMDWYDEYLKWNASEYGGHKVIFLSPTRIWKPDLTLYNNAKKDGALLFDLSYQARIYNDGKVSVGFPSILKSVCPIDIGRFPFDTQRCKLKIGSWRYNGLHIDLRLPESSNGINLKNLEANSVWELRSVSSVRNTVEYKCCPEPYYDITFTLEFRRKPLYYIMTILFPSILLSLLSCISFLFPADSGERVSLVISVLLGLVVFMLIVNERTPVTSDATPMLTKFFNAIGACTVLALMSTALILRLNHAPTSAKVPRYLACIRDCIAGALCMRRESSRKRVEINFGDVILTESQGTGNGYYRQWPLNIRDLAGLTSFRKQLTEEKILTELQKITEHLQDEKMESDTKEEWHYTMRVFDRFFFVTFLLICIAFTIYVFSFTA